MTIDPELVTRKLMLIARDLDALESIRHRGAAAYRDNAIDQAVAERHLERMIGRMIDVNYHLLTESGQPPPTDYYMSFVQLARLGALDADFARRMAACAGLRNRIVHEYNEIDHDRVYEALGTALSDIPVYIAAVDDFLTRSRDAGEAP
jgi:uncharacterized protein YutE (UPF0331/DUF86 family)